MYEAHWYEEDAKHSGNETVLTHVKKMRILSKLSVGGAKYFKKPLWPWDPLIPVGKKYIIDVEIEHVAVRVGGGGGGWEVEINFILEKGCQFDENLRVPLM